MGQFESYEALVLEAEAPDRGRIIVKLAYPTRFAASIAASRAFSGHGGVPVIAADETAGLLLMRKIEPGHTLLPAFQQGRDDEATEAAAQTIARLRTIGTPPAGPFDHISEHADAFARWQSRHEAAMAALPLTLLRRAESMLAELLRDAPASVLLHGDLHHDNIVLDAQSRAYVIDPKGRLGDPAYEVGAWMRNPMDLYEAQDPSRLLTRRFDIFCSVLGDDRERLQRWSFVQVCLAALWLYEDEQELWPRAFEFAELLLHA